MTGTTALDLTVCAIVRMTGTTALDLTVCVVIRMTGTTAHDLSVCTSVNKCCVSRCVSLRVLAEQH